MNNLVHPLTLVAVIFIFALPRATSRINCDFEDDQMCGYTHNTPEHHGFSRIAGPPLIKCTGLENDHTFASPKGHYIHTGDPNYPDATIVSRTYTPLSTMQCLEVWYYMKSGRRDCQLVIVFDEQGPSRHRIKRFDRKGDTYSRWNLARIDVYAETVPFQLRIIASTNYISGALIALDDISIKPWRCNVSSSGPDEVLLDPRPSDILEHTLVDVLCTCGNCLPACTVKWSFNDVMFQQGDRLRLNASRNTNGSYTCTCINDKSFQSKELGFELNVRYGPDKAILDPALTQQARQEHSLLSASCHCSSCSPTCFVKWSLDGVHFGSGNELQLNVSRTSAGNYSCICINPLTNKSESTYFELTTRFGPDQAILDPALTHRTMTEHSSLNASCTCGNCTPSCYNLWFLNGVKVGNSSRLWFSNVSRNSGGRYTCSCTNPETSKSESKDFELTVNYGPDEVVLTPAATAYTVEEFSAMVPVSCNCGKCKPSCTARWISNTLNISFKEQCSLELRNVTTNSAGQYKCICVNPYTAKTEVLQFYLTVQSKMITNEGTSSSEITEAGAKTSENKEMTIIASLGTGAGVCIVFLVLLLAYVIFGRKRRQHENKNMSGNETLDRKGTTVRTNGHDNFHLHSIYRTPARTRLDKPSKRDPPIDYEISY